MLGKIILILFPSIIIAQLPAFPGADGYGKLTTGGRGGMVIHVTNLNDSGVGSLRDALEEDGDRTIVFDVGGTIELVGENSLQIGSTDFAQNVAEENVTIAGETAPYPGITITGGGIEIYTSNVIIRYITIRVDIATVETNDALRIKNWGVSSYDQRNIMIDHVSVSHGSDENLSVDALNLDATTEDITLQYILIGENTQQAKGFLRGDFAYNVSFLYNYFTKVADRTPLIGYGLNSESIEVINNVNYGGLQAIQLSRGNIVDVISNVYESFPSDPYFYNIVSLGSQGYGNPIGTGAFHITGNFIDGPKEAGVSDYSSEAITYNEPTRQITGSLVTSWETDKAAIVAKVLPTVGNSLYRDAYDTDAVNAYYTDAAGSYSYTPVVIESQTTHPVGYDTDNDGMADAWEIERSGSIALTANGDDDSDGYTNIEEFFHYRAGSTPPTQTKSSLFGF